MEKECIVNGYLSEDQIACFELLDKENIWSDYADFRVTLKDGTFIYVTPLQPLFGDCTETSFLHPRL